MPVVGARQTKSALRIVEETRALRWWVDEQIAKGRTDEEIEAMLPVATRVITGEITVQQFISIMESA